MFKKIVLMVLGFALVGCGGRIQKTVFVDSQPQGAEILDAQGQPLGLRTPAYVELSPSIDSHLIQVSQPGFKVVPLVFNQETETDVISLKEVGGTIICAPFCLGLPLLNLLDPVDVNKRFLPGRVELKLERVGGGIHLRVFPPTTEVFVDGISRGQLLSDQEIFLKLTEGKHQLEFRASGFESVMTDQILIDDQTPIRLNVDLLPLSGGLYLRGLQSLPLDRVKIFEANDPAQVVLDLKIQDETYILQPLPQGDYLLEIYGLTSTGEELTQTKTFSANPKNLTIFDLSEFLSWQKIRPWLGVSLQESGELKNVSDLFGYKKDFAFRYYPKINKVSPGSPAHKAGLLEGDLILSLNGQEFSRPFSMQASSSFTNQLKEFLKNFQPKDQLLIEVEREGKIIPFKIQALGSVNE